ncbi:GAF domain-containing protein [Mucilaginibacter sp. CAU 1740]|uniref:GAF domain-containing protein n=1 Tax=Mucilaginibacter sp. CAU 1740 TaxID=3140365 RepID=UPI00325BB6DF
MPLKELERIAAVNRFLKLEISKEKELQEIVALAAQICDTPTALITLIDADTQHIKFKTGFALSKTSRKEAFCDHVVRQQETLIVSDASQDSRFAGNPLVLNGPRIRFYAGVPLLTGDGQALGSLCVIDQKPRELSVLQVQMLQGLSKQVIQLLEFDTSLKVLKEQYVAARNAEIKLRSFFESETSCHLLIGKNMEILAYNKALEAFVWNMYQVKILPEMKVTDYINKAYTADFLANYQLALSGQPVKLERRLDYPDRTIWWYFSFDPARNDDGTIIGVSYNATDVTQLMLERQKSADQQNFLNAIAWSQSHELRRPVASVMGLMNVIKEADYQAEKEELLLMENAIGELDQRVRHIIALAEGKGYTGR